MVGLFILILLTIISFFCMEKYFDNSDIITKGEGWVALFALFIISLIIYIWVLCMNPYWVRNSIKQFEAYKQTLENTRLNKMTEFERATIMEKTADWNEWLASKKYNKSLDIFKRFIPDEIDEIEFIK